MFDGVDERRILEDVLLENAEKGGDQKNRP